MSDNENMLKNIDMISRLISANGGNINNIGNMVNGNIDADKILNAISTAKNMGILPNTTANDKPFEVQEDNKCYETGEYQANNEGIRIVKAAIPFLNKDFQKSLFLAIRLMEMNKEFDEGTMSLQCQSIREDNDEKQRESMLRAVRGQVSPENGRRLDMVLKLIEFKKLADIVK